MFWQKLERSDTQGSTVGYTTCNTTVKSSFLSQRICKYISTLIGENQTLFLERNKECNFYVDVPILHTFISFSHSLHDKAQKLEKKKKLPDSEHIPSLVTPDLF